MMLMSMVKLVVGRVCHFRIRATAWQASRRATIPSAHLLHVREILVRIANMIAAREDEDSELDWDENLCSGRKYD